MTVFDPIQRPRHYASHPSGIECITLAEHMSFNLGNGFKYGWRGGMKHEDAAEDYGKMLWYVKREFERGGVGARSESDVEVFRAMLDFENTGRRVFARPSPWVQPIHTALALIVDIQLTRNLGESIRLFERTIERIETALAA